MLATRDDTSDAIEVLVAEATDEFLDRARRGEHPDIDEYVRRFPQIAAVLRGLLPALRSAHRGSSAAGANGTRRWHRAERSAAGRPTRLPVAAGPVRRVRPAGQADQSAEPIGSAGRVPADSRTRPRRHGNRLRGGADFARPPRGSQSFAAGRGARSAAVAAVSPGSSGRRPLAPLAYRADLFRRLRTRRLLLCDAIHRRAQPGRRDCRARSAAAGPRRPARPVCRSTRTVDGDARRTERHATGRRTRPHELCTLRRRVARGRYGGAGAGDGGHAAIDPESGLLPHDCRHGSAGGRGARLRPWHGRDSSRHQAREFAARRRRADLHCRFRLGPASRRLAADADRRFGRHAAVHEPGADDRAARGGRSSGRSLFAGGDAVRVVDVVAGVRRAGPAGAAAADRRRRAAGSAAAEPSHSGRFGNDRAEGDGQGAAPALCDRQGIGRGFESLSRASADYGPPADAWPSGRANGSAGIGPS